MHWFTLVLAVLSNVAANLAFKAAMQGASAHGPIVALKTALGQPALWMGTVAAFVLFASYLVTLRAVHVGIAYAIVTGAALALMTLLSAAIFGETLSPRQLSGLGLILAGTLLLTLQTDVPLSVHRP